MQHAIQPLMALYGCSAIAKFGPSSLKVVRQRMVESGLSRKVVNARINRIRRIFKWGVENELVEPRVLQVLQAVAPLKQGRTQARETEPVKPVLHAHIEAVRPYLTDQVSAMIDLQLLTGMRPGEVVMMRWCDIDTASDTWVSRHDPQISFHLLTQTAIERFLQSTESQVDHLFYFSHSLYLHAALAPFTSIKDPKRANIEYGCQPTNSPSE